MTFARWAKLIWPVAYSLYLQLLGIALLFSTPLCAIILCCGLKPGHMLRRAAWLTVAVLSVHVAIVACFTATIAGASALETIDRVHFRYYSFVFPLLFVLAAGFLTVQLPRTGWGRGRLALVAAFGALLALAAWRLPLEYKANFVDSPELASLAGGRRPFYLLVGLSAAALAAFAWRPKLGIATYLFVFAPLAVATSGFHALQLQRHHVLANEPIDRSGRLARLYLEAEVARTIVIGSDGPQVFRVLFQLDSPGAQAHFAEPGAAIPLSALPSDRTTAIVVGEHQLSFEATSILSTARMSIVRLPPREPAR
jgi:phosphoglycerol transferase